MHILRRKRTAAVPIGILTLLALAVLNGIQTDRRLQHQQYVIPVMPNLLHHPRNLL